MSNLIKLGQVGSFVEGSIESTRCCNGFNIYSNACPRIGKKRKIRELS